MIIDCGFKGSGRAAPVFSSRLVCYAQFLALVAVLFGFSNQLATGKSQWDDQSLIADVETLNGIVTRYKRAGGWFSERDNAQRVMVRLAMAQGDFGVTMLGKNSGHRMVPVIAAEPPQKAKWAYWNVASEQFQVWRGVAPHKVQIVTRFARRQDSAPLGLSVQPSSGGTRQRAQSTPAKRARSAQGRGANMQPASANMQPASPSLLPPRFDPPAGKFNALEFEKLTVHLLNPNAAGAGKIQYSINGAPWKNYDGQPLRVLPGSEVLAYCNSDERSHLSDSAPVGARYVLEALKINLELKAPVRQLPADALRVGKGGGGFFPVLSISNIASVPASVRSRKFFEVVWTIDGSDPLHSETAFPVTFSGGYGMQARLPLSVLSNKSPDKLRIRAAARSTDRHLMLDCREAAIELEIIR